MTTLHDAFDHTFGTHNEADFKIYQLHVDPEFLCLEDLIADRGVIVIPFLTKQHAPDLEHCKRTTQNFSMFFAPLNHPKDQ